MKFCPRCGTKTPDAAAVCPLCGKRLSGEADAKRPSPRPADASHGKSCPSEPRHASPGSSSGASGPRAAASSDRPRPEATGRAAPVSGVFAWISRFFGNARAAEVDVPSLFSSVFKRHSIAEAEEIFVCGTDATTPSPSSVAASWPRPWLFSRILIAFAATYFPLYICLVIFKNENAIPNMMVAGSFAVPISTMVLFFELNVWKNINIYRVFLTFAVAGAASIVLCLVFYEMFPTKSATSPTWPKAFVAGIGEEVAKAVLVLAAMKIFLKTPQRLLNGLLIGAAVGAGFAAMESAGYSFNYYVGPLLVNFVNKQLASVNHLPYEIIPRVNPVSTMQSVIFIRGILAPGGHVAWAALHGAALSIVARSSNLDFASLFDARFLRIAIFPVIMHIAWDAPVFYVGAVGYLKCTVLIAAVWIAVFVLVHRGLDEVRHIYSRPIE